MKTFLWAGFNVPMPVPPEKRFLVRYFTNNWMNVVCACVLVYASWVILAGEHRVHGDGVEYILQTQAIALHGQLHIESANVREYWNKSNPYGITLSPPREPQSPLTEAAQAGGGWGGLYPDRFGDYRYYHFWAYSLVAAPIYLFLHLIAGSPFEYHAFRALNWLLLLAPFVGAWLRKRSWTLIAILALSLFSPLVPYADWQHPELFCYGLIFFSFWLAASARLFWWSPLLLGIAAAQNIPIGLVFPLHLVYLLKHHRIEVRSSPGLAVGAYGLAALVAFSSLFYWRYYFGCFNVIAAVGLADLRYASLGRVCDIFFSPAVGAVWLYPTLFLFLPLMIRKRDVPAIAIALVTVAGMAYLASATRNFNSGQIGSLRYAIWILAPLWYFLVSGEAPEHGRRKAYRIAIVVGLILANILVIFAFKYDRLARKDIRRVGGAWRGVPEVAAVYNALRYNDDVEIVVENILGHELNSNAQFCGVYVWNLGLRSSLWVIAERGLTESVLAEWKTAEPFGYGTLPRGNELVLFTNGMARLVVPQNARFREHPYLGKYIAAWLDTAVDKPREFVEMHLRDSRTTPVSGHEQ